jgi:hypothetical protein
VTVDGDERSESAGGEWLPPVSPGPVGPPPRAPAGWRVSPRAVDLDPNAPPGPEPWADPGNSVAGMALGLSVAGFGVFCLGLGLFALPLAIAGSVLSWVGRGRIMRGETRQGKVEVAIGLVVGVATIVIIAVILIVYLATR